jgi:hypothetical protein
MRQPMLDLVSLETSNGNPHTYLIQAVCVIKVTLTHGTDVLLFHMLPVIGAIDLPMRPFTVIAVLTDGAASLFAATIQKVFPTLSIEVTFWTLAVAR